MSRHSLAALEAEAEGASEPVAVRLGEAQVSVLPVGDWPAEAFDAARAQDFDAWADYCLATDADFAVWDELDPSLRQIDEMLDDWGEQTGHTLDRIVELRAILEDHHEAVEADLQSCYQVDIRGLWRGGLTYRQLDVYLRWLPSESATATSLRNGLTKEQLAALAADTAAADRGHGRWSHTDFLLAAIIDGVRTSDYHQVLIAGAKGARAPDPVERPGVAVGRGARILTPQGVRYFDELDRIQQQEG